MLYCRYLRSRPQAENTESPGRANHVHLKPQVHDRADAGSLRRSAAVTAADDRRGARGLRPLAVAVALCQKQVSIHTLPPLCRRHGQEAKKGGPASSGLPDTRFREKSPGHLGGMLQAAEQRHATALSRDMHLLPIDPQTR